MRINSERVVEKKEFVKEKQRRPCCLFNATSTRW